MKLPKQIFSDRLGRRFALYIVLLSSCFTIISTAVQLVLDYNSDINRIEQQFENIQSSYIKALTLSVWSLDDSQIVTQLRGLQQLPDIEYVAISTDGITQWEFGERLSKRNRSRDFDLIYQATQIDAQQIGTLRVSASIDAVVQRLIQKASIILVGNGIKTFAVSGFIMLLIWYMITRHLASVSRYISQLNPKEKQDPLKLSKSPNAEHKKDELDIVVEAINQMQQSLLTSYQEIHLQRDNLEQLLSEREVLLENEQRYKSHLEELVYERTVKLEQSLEELQSAQSLLIESEKMAALGSMVAGVAHEINTPIGVCLTAASFQGEHCRKLTQHMADGTLTKQTLSRTLDDILDASIIFESNISKASSLIASFKQIATDQSHDVIQQFALADYINASIQTLSPQLKHRNVSIQADVCGKIHMESYPGAIHHILSNLINNSVLHGFSSVEENGEIILECTATDDEVQIDYHDSGCGLSNEAKRKIFEPFYTTRRGDGGSGLGMSIVFNIITNQLKGRIEVAEDGHKLKGVHLRINLPRTTPQDTGILNTDVTSNS